MARLKLDDVPCAAVGHGECRTPENDDFLPAAHVKVGRGPLGGRTKMRTRHLLLARLRWQQRDVCRKTCPLNQAMCRPAMMAWPRLLRP